MQRKFKASRAGKAGRPSCLTIDLNQPKTGETGWQPVPLQKAAARIGKLSTLRPTLAIVLGSGFHHVLTELKVEARLAYGKIPSFPLTGVAGHSGELLIGKLGGTPVVVLSGRAHFYEGHPMESVVFPTRSPSSYSE